MRQSSSLSIRRSSLPAKLALTIRKDNDITSPKIGVIVMRRFHLVRKDNGAFIVGGTLYEDGGVCVRQNATGNLPCDNHGWSTYASVAWFMAVHGREGDAVMQFVDDVDETTQA